LREREYWRFCLDHVRQYNHTYNFFAGMSPDDIARYQKEAVIGHRPTWKMGMNGGRPASRSHSSRFRPEFTHADDPFGVFREFGEGAGAHSARRPSESRVARNAQRKALDTLGLDADASAQEVKTRFKALVKRHHPDANGGDRSSEERLREIIQAYNYLKSIGIRRRRGLERERRSRAIAAVLSRVASGAVLLCRAREFFIASLERARIQRASW
jgi:hypothetical protein